MGLPEVLAGNSEENRFVLQAPVCLWRAFVIWMRVERSERRVPLELPP